MLVSIASGQTAFRAGPPCMHTGSPIIVPISHIDLACMHLMYTFCEQLYNHILLLISFTFGLFVLMAYKPALDLI